MGMNPLYPGLCSVFDYADTYERLGFSQTLRKTLRLLILCALCSLSFSLDANHILPDCLSSSARLVPANLAHSLRSELALAHYTYCLGMRVLFLNPWYARAFLILLVQLGSIRLLALLITFPLVLFIFLIHTFSSV
jgi:hypothetical protein